MQLTATVRSVSCRGGLTRKILRVLKLTTVFLFAGCMHVSATGFTQQITLHVKDAPLKQVFKEIKRQTGYTFAYNDALIDQAKKVTVELQNATIEQALVACFSDQPFTFEIIDKIIVVKQKSPSTNIPNGAPTNQPNPPTDITGRITNEQGEPLAGASVIVKRTGKGDIADANGNFKLHNVATDDVIEISFTGYKKQSIKVGDRTNFTPILEVAVDELDRAMVQAYGKTTQRFATGNIAKVTAEEIERQPVMNPLLALQGKVAGLNVTQTSGFASAPIKVELRGRSAVNSSFTSDPLYIIDGVPLTVLEIGGTSGYSRGSTGFIQNQNQFIGPAQGQSPLFSINPADIESIEVLKDADATSIYGSRGANGVILINTKRGIAGQTKFDLHIDEGVNHVTRFFPLLNTRQYLAMRGEAFKNDGITPDEGTGYDLLVWDTTRYTNWQKALYGGTGMAINAQAGLSGGDTHTTFRIGLGYNHTSNILTVSGADQRGSLSFNINHRTINQRFGVTLSGGYSFSQSDMVNLPNSFTIAPDAPSIYDAEGNLNYAGWGGNTSNTIARSAYPFAGLKQPYTAKTNFLSSNLKFNYQPIRGLTLSTSFGYNMAQANQRQWNYIAAQDPLNNPKGSATWGYNSNKNWIIEPQLNYDIVLGKGKLGILAGGTIQATHTEGLTVAGSGFTDDNLIKVVSNAPVKNTSDIYGQYKYAAFFARVNYNWENKYLINVSVRRDGSSRFGTDRRYGNFGSIGAAWIFTQDKWLSNYLSFLSFGKLRGSYGTTGSDGIGDYKYLTRWSSSGQQVYNGVQSIVPTQHANPDFQWQVDKKLEAGIDLGFLKDRATISAAFYRNRCGNQLVDLPISVSTGFGSVAANSPALVENTGWEFVAWAGLLNTKNFDLSVNFNLSINRNKLVGYPNLDLSPYATTLIVGRSLNIVRLLHYTGVDPQTGLYSFQDKNHDGIINGFADSRTNDLFVYDLDPKYIGGIGTNFSYKAIQLSLLFTIKKQIGINGLFNSLPGNINNISASIPGKQWVKPGDMATYAKFSTQSSSASYVYFSAYSDGIYTDASFVRLSNLSLSYNIPEKYLRKIGLQGCSLYFHSNNLFVITNYKGGDPETQNIYGLPPTKTSVGGITLNF